MVNKALDIVHVDSVLDLADSEILYAAVLVSCIWPQWIICTQSSATASLTCSNLTLSRLGHKAQPEKFRTSCTENSPLPHPSSVSNRKHIRERQSSWSIVSSSAALGEAPSESLNQMNVILDSKEAQYANAQRVGDNGRADIKHTHTHLRQHKFTNAKRKAPIVMMRNKNTKKKKKKTRNGVWECLGGSPAPRGQWPFCVFPPSAGLFNCTSMQVRNSKKEKKERCVCICVYIYMGVATASPVAVKMPFLLLSF